MLLSLAVNWMESVIFAWGESSTTNDLFLRWTDVNYKFESVPMPLCTFEIRLKITMGPTKWICWDVIYSEWLPSKNRESSSVTNLMLNWMVVPSTVKTAWKLSLGPQSHLIKFQGRHIWCDFGGSVATGWFLPHFLSNKVTTRGRVQCLMNFRYCMHPSHPHRFAATWFGQKKSNRIVRLFLLFEFAWICVLLSTTY